MGNLRNSMVIGKTYNKLFFLCIGRNGKCRYNGNRNKGGRKNDMIRFEDVSKEFHTKAGNVQGLNHVNLHISKGDIFGIIGMSGAGKSTFIRCINYLEHPTSGDVRIDGCPNVRAVGTTAA